MVNRQDYMSKDIKELAKFYSNQFELSCRNDGTQFTRLKDGLNRPDDDELKELIYDIHKELDSLPNYWIYRVIWDAFDAIDEYVDWDEDALSDSIGGYIDVYNHDLLAWLNEPFASDCIDNAIDELGMPSNDQQGLLYTLIAAGQYYAIDIIFRRVTNFLGERLDV